MPAQLNHLKPLEFEWNEVNKYKNWEKHQVDFRECEEIFSNKPLLISFDKKHSKVEKRFQALGQTNNKRKLFISFTIKNNRIRIISARDQNRKERKEYEKK